MRISRSLPLLFVAFFAIHCAGTTPEPASSGKDECAALDAVRASCPPDWEAAVKDSATFCAEHPDRMFDVSVSSEACRGRLHYTRHLFDAGPRVCLYDPTSKALVGYGAFDGKARHNEWSCGIPRAEFDEKGCAVTACPER